MTRHLLAASAALAFATACAPAAAPPPAARATPPSGAAGPTPACPATDFDGFLRAFASDARVREAFTAPWVRVTDWVDVDATERGTETSRVPRDRYRDFRLRHDGTRYVHVEHDDMPDPVPVEPRVSQTPDGHRVEYIFAMSEGNSWIFARTAACWQLAADPDPSLL